MLINLATLLSRRIRSNALAGKTGRALLSPFVGDAGKLVRRIGNLTQLATKAGEDKGIVAKIWDAGKAFIGFAGGLIKGIAFSATAIWSWTIGAIEQLKTFDWNASDAALQQMIGDQNLALAQIWGGVVGSGLGWLAGISVGYGIAFICPVIGGAALARMLATKVGEEALEEFMPTLTNAIRLTAASFAKAGLINGYINFRKFLKKAPRGLLEAVYGKDGADFIQKFWGVKDGPNMSFNTVMDETIERIPNKYVKAFFEEMAEEAWDSFTEAGFIIAQEIDEAYAQNKLQNQKQLGTERTVVLEPDREAEKEKVVLTAMPQKLLMPAVQQTLVTHRLLYNRDVGALVGMPVDDYLKAKPQGLRLVIQFYAVKTPPFQTAAGLKVRVTLTVPDLRRAALDWEKIKLACGGVNGYLWGRFRATANLDNGRQMAVYGGTEEEAEDRLKALLALSEAEILTLSVTEEKKEGARLKNPKLQKETTRVYPAYCTILNREIVLNPGKGKASSRQNYRDKRAKLILWTEREPPEFKDKIKELIRHVD